MKKAQPVDLWYAWLSKEHPDPELFHLVRLVRVLKEMKAFTKMDEIGVIIDFCSLWQKHGETDSRSEIQFKEFKDGLKEINTPYAHKEVMALKMMAVPDSVPRKYDDRGWTLFESILIDGKSASSKLIATNCYGAAKMNLATFGLDFDYEHEVAIGLGFFEKFSKAQRRPPCTPARFVSEMKTREVRAKQKNVDLFTSGADHDFVIKKYKKAFAELVLAEEFDFFSMNWGDEEVDQLAEVLCHCSSLLQGCQVVLFHASVGWALVNEPGFG